MAEGALVSLGTLAAGVKGARLGSDQAAVDTAQVLWDVWLWLIGS